MNIQAAKPIGKLGRRNGITGFDGCYRTTYAPSYISALINIRATIEGITGQNNIGVGVGGLVQLLPGTNYRLIGGGSEDCNAPTCTTDVINSVYAKAHPSNHWGVAGAVAKLPKIADAYKAQYYGSNSIPPAEMVHFNDISLVFGGKFDLKRSWLNTGSHVEHREGKNIDTRSNNIPSGRHAALMDIFNNNGSGYHDERFNPETPPHWHLKWGNLTNTRAGLLPLQNGIDPGLATTENVTEYPSSLANNIGEAIFERQVTQDEFEIWFAQLSNAKSQGSYAFLQEIKALEKQLFASPEYVARQRTDEEFVKDVFESHLFREPTQGELSYWLNYLQSIQSLEPITPYPTPRIYPYPGNEPPIEDPIEDPPIYIPMSEEERRQLFLDYFQTLPNFVNKVASVVDDVYPEPPH